MAAPQPLDLSHHFSFVSKNRSPSSVKDFYKYFVIPGIANFAGGFPHPSYFPFDTLEATVAQPRRLQPIAMGDSNSERVIVPKESTISDPLQKIDLTTGLQYGTAEGYPPLLQFLRQFTRDHLHPNIPYRDGAEVILSCGNTDGFGKTIELFTNYWSPDQNGFEDREGVLCEEFTYMNAVQTARPRGLNVVGVAMDGQGMRASGDGGLGDVLKNWDTGRGRRPHLLYTITVGQNPTGGTLPIQRKKELYALCQEYDLIIVEDEPYWNLQFPSAYTGDVKLDSSPDPKQNRKTVASNQQSSGYAFLDSLAPSYLSIDVDGRVVRLDTFSKTIAPGSRLGWITAQPAIIERLARITEVTTQQPSGFVQSVVAGTILGNQLDNNKAQSSKGMTYQGWHLDGWVRWLEGLRGGHERRMQAMCTVLEDNKFAVLEGSPTKGNFVDDWEVVDRIQMFDFVWPKAGMFTWVEVLFETHPLRFGYSPETLSKAFWVHLTRKPHLCLVGPGSLFAATPESAQRAHRYIRLAFAPMDVDEVTPFTQRLIKGFRSFWQLKNLDGLQTEDNASIELS